jgi:hypothetical protein
MQSAQLQLVSLWAHDCMHTCIWGAAWSEGGAAVAVHSYLFERHMYHIYPLWISTQWQCAECVVPQMNRDEFRIGAC